MYSHPLVQIRENPKFHDLTQRDKSTWPRCLLWHGWLPALSALGAPFAWAVGPGHVASSLLETSLGTYTCRILEEWSPPEGYSAEDARLRLPDLPIVWTDGSLVREEVSGCCSGGAGVYAHVSGSAWFHRSWGHLDLLPVDADTGLSAVGSFLLYLVLSSLSSVLRSGL